MVTRVAEHREWLLAGAGSAQLSMNGYRSMLTSTHTRCNQLPKIVRARPPVNWTSHLNNLQNLSP